MSYLDSLFSGVGNTLPKVGVGPLPGGGSTKPAVAPTPGTPAPPPGFTAQEWAQLVKRAKNNPSLDALIKKYTAGNTASADASWRRVMPTDTSQLLKQLSYNAGEMGMPGGYVGAVQLPAYGETQPPINNPDMSTYGQGKGIGEATYYQQSMKGGMAPIAAMSPLGVPANWNPGGASGDDVESQLKDYLNKLHNGGGGGGGNGGGTMKQQLKAGFDKWMHDHLGGGGFQGVFAGFPGGERSPRAGKGGGKGNGDVTNWPGTEHPGGNGSGNKPGMGVPISRPFGY